jgi:ABC-type polysaccharide/polyol phosphate export permease
MAFRSAISNSPGIGAADRKPVISPTPGGAFSIARQDVIEAVGLAPVWLHEGWINVVWRFRRTRLGPFWHTLGLAGFVLTMGVIWSTILKIDPYEYFRYVTVNLIVWSLIAAFITDGTATLVNEQTTALSMRYPYIAFAFAHIWRALLLFAHHFVLYVAVIVFTLYPVGWAVLLAVPGLVLLAANGVWLSLFFGILGLRWRDIAPATSTAMQVLIFVTPVYWPKEMLGPNLAFAADFNPLYHFVRIVRDPLLGTAPPLSSWIWVLSTLAVGTTLTLWVYGRFRERMPYWY